MKILKANFEKTDVGLFIETADVSIIFGNKKSDLDVFLNRFPKLRFQKIKQTHSDIVIEATDQIHKADGHFSSFRNIGLLISTADCLPVLIYCSQTKRIASVHAGWKGVANQIVLKTLNRLITSGSSQKNFEFWIGPHILQNSFEVQSDVLAQLEDATYAAGKKEYCFEKNGKYYVNLERIVYSQIANVTNSNAVIHTMDIDTKTTLEFWSFRREKEAAGRNLSFIALK